MRFTNGNIGPATLASNHLCLARDGAQHIQAAIDGLTLQQIRDALPKQDGQAGLRLFGEEKLRPFLLATGPIGAIAARYMLGKPFPVRAILFDKNPSANWSLPWHQDRVVAVTQRVEVPGFSAWTRKHGALHVAPPYEVLAGMLTLRLHLDRVPKTNAPLLIAPGSHRMGRIAEPDIARVVIQCGTATCLAESGDIWLYSTPILHASETTHDPRHRRVLQIDYATADLPGGLQWLGI